MNEIGAGDAEHLALDLRSTIERLARLDRASTSDGERRAADWIAGELVRRGATGRTEAVPAHGGYWWPLGMLSALAVVAGALGSVGRPSRHRRAASAVLGAFAWWAIADDAGGGRLWFRRSFLRHGRAHNAFGEIAGARARRTIVFIAHHDAAHSGFVFDPRLANLGARPWLKRLARRRSTPAAMLPVAVAPALALAGATLGIRRLARLGAMIGCGSAAVFADIGGRPAVAGANDNLTGVAVLLALADRLSASPADGLRVVLLSTGSEESFMEGMQGFARRHFDQLAADTVFVCVDTVGSRRLVQLEGEGMLRLREYDQGLKDLLERCALDGGVQLDRGLWFRNATDGLIPLRHGFATAVLGSTTANDLPSNYHWPTDLPENVDFATVAGAVDVCEAVVRALDCSVQPSRRPGRARSLV